MEDNKIIVQVDKTVIKIEGLSIKGLNLQEVERIISNKLNSLVRIIGVTGKTIERDVYGIEEEDILKDERGIIKAVSLAEGITLSDLAQISRVKKIKSFDIDHIPEHNGGCRGERWL